MTIEHRRRAAFTAAVSIVAVAITSLTGCSSGASGGDDEKTVTINQAFQSLLYLPLYVARDEGYFEDEGLTVNIDTGGSGNTSFAAVLGGSAGFSIQDPIFVPKSREQGGDGVVVAGVQDAPALFLIGQDDHDVQNDPKYLEGKKVIVSPAPDSPWAFMTKLIEQNDLQNVELVNVALGNELAAVASGQADYAVVAEPTASQAISNQGLHLVYSWPAAGDDWNPFAFSSLTSTTAYIDQNPELTQSVVNAFQRAYNFIYSNPEGAIAVAQKQFPDLDPATTSDAVGREIDANAYPRHAVVTQEAWDHNLSIAAEIDNVDGYPSDATAYENNVNTEFAMEAMEQFPSTP